MKKVEHRLINNIEYKRCCRCKQWIVLEEYYNDNHRTDGLHGICKQCCKEYNKELYSKTVIWNNSIDGKYSNYRSGAKRRSTKKFSLTKTEFALLISSPCYYCGDLQENFNGVDRVDNEKGYTINNCVSCCSMCNRMKNIFTEEKFIMKCKQIVEKQKVILSH